ncbi:ribbon-helix-helix protein, CopG family [Silvibacterium sp.]|uniref:ribbon-helix-helix protein, CopG family n=1 Tax=Silvibacterium sp. TaxID=1964179 RepID=UPI0039E36C9B
MPTLARKPKAASATRRKPAERERVLIEFPASLLKKADQAAAAQSRNRSEFIRRAVEQAVEAIERRAFEEELAAAYRANSELGLEVAGDFEHIDQEGL